MQGEEEGRVEPVKVDEVGLDAMRDDEQDEDNEVKDEEREEKGSRTQEGEGGGCGKSVWGGRGDRGHEGEA